MIYKLIHMDGLFAIFINSDLETLKVTFKTEADISFLKVGEWYELKDFLQP